MRREAQGPANIRVHDKLLAAGFVMTPVSLLRLPGIGMGAKLLYSAILHYSHVLKFWPGIEAAAADFSISERSITSYLKELEASGIVRVARDSRGYIEEIECLSVASWAKTVKQARVQILRAEGEAVSTQKMSRRAQSLRAASSSKDSRDIKRPALDPSASRKASRRTFAQAELAKGKTAEQVVAALARMNTPQAEAEEIIAGLQAGSTKP